MIRNELARRLPTLAAALLLALAAPARADFTFHVAVDSSAVPSGTSGSIYFQFNPGGATRQAATALVSNLQESSVTFAGGMTVGDATPSGVFPAGGTLALDNRQITNGLLESVTFGGQSRLSFDLTLDGPAVNAPDGNPNDAATSFFFGVLDSSFNPLLPLGAGVDPLVEVDILPGTGGFAVIDTQPVAIVSAGVVPEPGSPLLMGLGLAMATTFASRRRRPARRPA